MSRTTVSGVSGSLLRAFPDSSCDPRVIGDLLFRLAGRKFVYLCESRSLDLQFPEIAYCATRDVCLEMAQCLREAPAEVLQAWLEKCRERHWLSPECEDEFFVHCWTVWFPSYLCRLKKGYRALD